MNNETKININGQDIRMLYTAAAEKGFEDMTGQSSAVFINNGKIYDWATLGLACIVAAYAEKDEDPPVKSKDLLYNWGSDDVESLIKTTIELRRAWYKIPEVIKTETEETQKGKATININGQDIRMLYTAAAEKGFEDMTGQSSAVFMNNGKIYDWATLGLACIVAAYAEKDEDPPVKSKDLLYNWGPKAVESLIKTTIELRRAWYKIPEVIKTEEEETPKDEEQPKN
jgi:hypothetical protein